ncbi:MAG: integrase core domain-containing protein, partial [Burkholderiales bacterium]
LSSLRVAVTIYTGDLLPEIYDDWVSGPRAAAQERLFNCLERLAEAEIEPSVGSVGDSYDNALAETINGLYKAEVIHRRSWRNLQDVELATLEWVDWFNHKRLLGPIGDIPPAEAEAVHYRLQRELTMAA